jgi:hypothetical protein
MTRSMLLIGIMASIILPLDGPRSIAQTAPTPSRILLQEKSLSKDITYFALMEQLDNAFYKADIIVVDFRGRPIPQCDGRGVPGANNRCGEYLANPASFEGPRLKDLKIQAWVLRVDGTMLAQKASPIDGSICNAGDCTEFMVFVFEHVAPDELAGVVLRVDGKLVVRDIQADR